MVTVTVTGLTSTRMLAIEAASVVSGAVSGNDLILTKFSGATVNARNVRGLTGSQGIQGIQGTQGVQGPQGVQGSPGVGVTQRIRNGLYYGPEGSRSTAVIASGTMTLVPFWVSEAQAFDRIGAEVTTLIAASALRLGIYSDFGDGFPNARLLDAGTISSATVGAKELTIAITLQPGLYYLACAARGGAPGVRTVPDNIRGGAGAATLAVATGAAPTNGYTQTGVTGALPATYVQAGTTATPGCVVLRSA